jgi:hemerythrin-like domain-containing protein
MASIFSTDKPASFDDPLGMLLACHERIRRNLLTLGRLQRHLPEFGHDDDARAAARAILRYFDNAAPNHHADEEHSLLPRLRAAVPESAALAQRLEEEHALLGDNWRRLRPLLAAIATGQRANLSPRLVREVSALYGAHITFEEDLVIPLARESLDAAAFAEIGREMAARRSVTDPTPKPATEPSEVVASRDRRDAA